MKRVLVAAMHHESNSFNPIVAGENEFRVLRGQEFFENFRDNDSLTGVVKTLMDAGYEVVPAVSCRAVPNGEVDYDFYQGIKNEILEVARKENEKKPLDAITLSLHGSMRIKKIGDAEGYLLEDLRKPVFRRSTRKVPSFSSRHFFISFPASRFFLYLQQIFNALLGLFLLKKFF